MVKTANYTALSTHATSLLHALKYRDSYTHKHSTRVIDLSKQLGLACDLSQVDLHILNTAACLHDLGKVGTPDEVLLKPGKLTADEWEVMKSHSVIGEDIISNLPIEHAESIARSVIYHHEKFDGTGYPDGLSSNDISIHSRIISIVDNYDAITKTRTYQRARTHQQAMGIMSYENGIKFDPKIFNVFQNLIENSPYKVMD